MFLFAISMTHHNTTRNRSHILRNVTICFRYVEYVDEVYNYSIVTRQVDSVYNIAARAFAFLQDKLVIIAC